MSRDDVIYDGVKLLYDTIRSTMIQQQAHVTARSADYDKDKLRTQRDYCDAVRDVLNTLRDPPP